MAATQQFEEFNKNFREIESVFKEVTGVNFVFGQKFPDVDEQVRKYITPSRKDANH